MKKFFTLIVMALMAVGANAQTQEDIMSKFSYNWNNAESFTAENGTIVYNSASWGGLAAWLGDDGNVGTDWSAYDKIVFEFAAPTTCNTQILVQSYTEGMGSSAWGNEGIQKLECDLGAKAVALKQVALQTSAAVTLTITKIYLLKEAPTVTTAIWEGECVFGNWENGFNIAPEKFANANEGDIIEYVYTTNTNSEQNWYQFKSIYADTETTLTSNANELNDYGCASVNDGTTSYKIKLNATDIAQLKVKGLYTNGHYITVTKVNLIQEATSSVSAVKTVQQSGVRYNLAGQKVDASYKGVVIENGRKLIQK